MIYQKQQKKIVILDDDQAILASLRLLLEAEYETVNVCQTIDTAKELLSAEVVDLLLMDMNYSKGSTDGKEGLALIKELKTAYPELPIVVMTAFSEVSIAVESTKLGASDFIQKPWSNKRLLLTIENVLKFHSQQKQLNKYKLTLQSSTSIAEPDHLGMIGESNAIKFVRDKIRKIGDTDANVLILGENGTGKELVANAIHQQSARREQPFVKIDLGSIHQQLFESELYGAKKGAYTGLIADKIGRMTLADKGTLFLDELGNLEHSMQAKLLAALQNREIIPVGDVRAQAIDVRLISATNLPMHDLLHENTFRQDLLYRVNTIEIQLPPLRERSEDIGLLMDHFISLFRKKYNIDKIRYAPDTLKVAMMYDWPGNIRELEHSVERAVLLCENGIIRPGDLIPKRNELTPKLPKVSRNLNIDAMEKQLVQEALRINVGNMTKAADDLGITRGALYRRIEKHGL